MTDLACPFSIAAIAFRRGLVQISWPEELNLDRHKRFVSCLVNSPESKAIMKILMAFKDFDFDIMITTKSSCVYENI